MTALERAIDAARQASGYFLPDTEHETIARAVLMAVREASDDTLDGQCFRDMLDDILNEKDTTND